MPQHRSATIYAPTARLAAVPRCLAVACLAIAGVGIAMPAANAQSCQALWAERNGYYKEAGYCFKTQRAIAYFGNRGCVYDDEADVPLSANARGRIAEIKALERRFGCN